MPLTKLTLKPGVNRENTRYTNENGWYACDKIRFRQGTPEKIGGWVRVSDSTFLGVCRALFNWATLSGAKYVAVGTNVKYYIEYSSTFYDITPIRETAVLNNPFDTINTYTTVTVHDTAHGASVGDYVTFSGASTVGGLNLNNEYRITVVVDANTYKIEASSGATSTVTGGGGATVTATYQINTGLEIQQPLAGWGAGSWGSGAWGIGTTSSAQLRLWSQSNFGEDLVMNIQNGAIYYWQASLGLSSRAINITAIPVVNVLSNPFSTTNLSTTVTVTDPYHNSLAGDSVTFSGASAVGGLTISGTYTVTSVVSTTQYTITAGSAATSTATGGGTVTASYAYNRTAPTVASWILVSDVSRFLLAFGTNELGSADQDPMLIRWPDQESLTDWEPKATNQAGSLRLSRGSKILTALQARQEVLVWTDAALYSLQYLGAPYVWGATMLGDNVSLAGPNAVAYASGVAYWMGLDKFYVYDGTVKTLSCDLRRFVFDNINHDQFYQVYAGTNEGYSEIWWFYCSKDSTTNDRYVVYNYMENVWYYGTMGRTAWLDTGLFPNPQAATYNHKLVYQESGVDDYETPVQTAIEAYVESAEFDIQDGDSFGFVYRILPDVTFDGSTAENPSAIITLIPMQNSGSGYNDPTSIGGVDYATITRTAVAPIEQFTGQVFVRVRGRQMILRMESTAVGVAWQLGSPRIDIRKDGRRG